MNIQRFNELIKSPTPLGQTIREWQYFLEFVHAYFRIRNILNPVVVEIGVWHNAQKPFYRELLNAEHIGIDISGHPDILGDSRSAITVEKLRVRLAGRPIDLLFIDGDHAYDSVRRDYELYAPLAKYLIALHDISLVRWHDDPSDVIYYWQKLVEMEKQYTCLTFKRYNPPPAYVLDQMGIGLIIKEPA
jgi:hypothetical protein